MDKKSKILSVIIALAIIASVGTAFHKTIIKKDFEIVESEYVEETSGPEDELEGGVEQTPEQASEGIEE